MDRYRPNALRHRRGHPRVLIRAALAVALIMAGLAAVAATGARVVCLGGLLGALSGYGKRIGDFATDNNVTVTTDDADEALTRRGRLAAPG